MFFLFCHLVCLLLPALLVLGSLSHVETSENQRLFRHAADRMKSLHMMAVNMISDFVSLLHEGVQNISSNLKGMT